ncbi:hypothetical protein NEOLEDRAFT_1139508 [Neolentinus lepideus HHB14362 ss-1]|uniref:DRBM domain-containing protein n=1 Tax=Neolentinus lepideus HHB14362 ss-1 TaxID=1314782 RepID=A0A165PRD7_9AGAM|nr:hypothetical protein NEOLEDRAFT_1139508 [Neolentinus lepideus HHB14362 ss-1]
MPRGQEDPFKDWKMRLNNKIQQNEIVGRLKYETFSKGPNHEQTWISIATLDDVEWGRGEGPTRLAAENQASYQVVRNKERDREHPVGY